jgi:hypothetical protein
MIEHLKTFLGGVLCGIAVVLLTIRLCINVPLTGFYQLYCFALGQSYRIYWDIFNEWTQYKMDVEEWWNMWYRGVPNDD